jgi:hypothetical protein
VTWGAGGKMEKPTVEELEAAESNLGRAFMVAVAGVVCALAVGLWLPRPETRGGLEWSIFAGVELLLLGTYVWFAVAVGRAARHLVPSPWKYVLWVLAAPFLALIPIPIVSTVIGVSPLSLKFFFTGQLRSEIRARMLED